MKVSIGSSVSINNSNRQVPLTIIGINTKDYARTTDLSKNMPVSLVGDTMRQVSRRGAKKGSANNG